MKLLRKVNLLIIIALASCLCVFAESNRSIWRIAELPAAGLPDTIKTDMSISVCDYFVWKGETITESGIYAHRFDGSYSRDSIVTIRLTIHHSVTSEFTDYTCDTYTWNG